VTPSKPSRRPPATARTVGADGLGRYRAKRVASATPEPMGSELATGPAATAGFVVHEHRASRHHFDLRLEVAGVLMSWAIPHGPSMNPDDKRLAVKVENHPLEYVDFEAVIPPGNYGAGPMIVWDRGQFRPLMDPEQALVDGELKFELHGYKLDGAFTLVRTGKGTRAANHWLLIKKRDAAAQAFSARALPLSPVSVLSGLTVDELVQRRERAQLLLTEAARLGPAIRGPLPKVAPMLCGTAKAPFSSPDWLFELKYDGYRVLATGGDGRAELRYRSGQVATERFPEVAAALRALPCPGLVLDGELVVLDGRGHPDFALLQQRGQLTRHRDIARAARVTPVTLFSFDLLLAAGVDLRRAPLAARKRLLAQVVPPLGPIRYADHVETRGEDLLAHVVALGLEGIVAKKAASPYRSGRSNDWLKLKTDPEVDLAICGYSVPRGSRAGLGALHLCILDGGCWRYAGKVGTGMTDRELVTLRKQLDEAPSWKPPFPRPAGTTGSRFVEPHLVCQVRYRQWLASGSIRHPVFVRLRPDKEARECVLHRAAAGADEPAPGLESPAVPTGRALRLSNPKKVFWPGEGITKGDLVAYYRSIAPWMLPYLADRPVVMTRYPDGINGKWFYQKDAPAGLPPWLRTVALWSESSQRDIHYVLIDDADGLAYLANLGTIPIHVWASRTHDLGRPDWTILDFDPKGAPGRDVVALALAAHQLCETLGLPNHAKTSGQTGLHVLIPLAGLCTHEQARQLAYLLALVIELRHPTIATTERNPGKRGGRVYLDWAQNAHGQLLVAPFSVRPVPGATVSMPLAWDEVTPTLDVGRYTMSTALARMEALGHDPVRPVLSEKPDLATAVERLSELVRKESKVKR
jgi:bifunctional non-homologous end joining protein LigD